MASQGHNTPPHAPEPIDYSAELNITSNKLLRVIWLALGFIFTALGIIGAFLPVMPTTVFLLIAAYFFARSSPRFYNQLLNNQQFGPLIRDWRAGRGIPLRAKILAISMIVISITSSILIVTLTAIKLLLAVIGVSVSTYLITRPTKSSA